MQVLNCFTDGSCINNGHRNAVAAWACVWPDYPEYDKAEKLSSTELHTNNRAEYSGCLNAFRAAALIDPTYHRPLIIHTDSMLLINSMTKWIKGWKANGWKTKTRENVKNIDLLQLLDREMSLRTNTTFKYVKAHTNRQDWASIYNDKADKLAKAACTSGSISHAQIHTLSQPPSQPALSITKIEPKPMPLPTNKTSRVKPLHQTKITAFFEKPKL